jgi:pyruvate,orthophosphate dikinase
MNAVSRVLLFKEAVGRDKFVLGGKGYGLAEMTSIGLPVPPGFTVTTEACKQYYADGGKIPDGLFEEIRKKVSEIESVTGKKFGGTEKPLLFSVRSGAPFSMPGMMDTVLNLGLNDRTTERLAALTGSKRFAYDSYRRLIQMFGKVAMGAEAEAFEKILEERRKAAGVKMDIDLPPEELGRVAVEFKSLVKKQTGREFPQDPFVQLEMSVEAVLKSWNNERAKEYRKYYSISEELGTAVNIQAMVFGNAGPTSGSGVGFTRNPSTGEKKLFGEYLPNSQGEDVVAGIRTPLGLDRVDSGLQAQLAQVAQNLEAHFRDMQDFEFTVEDGRLYMLQTRNAKRTAQAEVKVAVEMAQEGLIDAVESVMRVEPEALESLLHRRLDPSAGDKPIAKGLDASPGAASGLAIFDTEEAASMGGGQKVILVRPETTPEDIKGIIAAQGVLTMRGGMTCVGGDTLVLTQNGFITAHDLFGAVGNGLRPSMLCFDHRTGRTVWRRIIAAGSRISEAIEVAVSQTGKSSVSTLRITPDHKMLTFETRKLIKRPLSELVRKSGFVCLIDKVPGTGSNSIQPLAYLVGALYTDGYVSLKRTKGSVTFTQKPTPAKSEFIETVRSCFEDVFESSFNIERMKHSHGSFEGRVISCSSLDLICTTRQPAATLSAIWDMLDAWVMSLDEISILSFIAGAADGDGTPAKNRIQIFNSDEKFVRALVLACLRIGILPQVTVNRAIYNVQIVERLDDILNYCHRVKGENHPRFYGTKLFSAKSLGSDLTGLKGSYRIKDSVRRNLLMDGKKFLRHVAKSCPLEIGEDIVRIISSDLRMSRVKPLRKLGRTRVYNFEVDATDELDKNFVVFTGSFAPVLVSNSHAAVVARGMGKPAVVGCSEIEISQDKSHFVTKTGESVEKGEVITIDGTTGNIYRGKVRMVEPEPSPELTKLLASADKLRRLEVWANADTPEAARKAREFGAEGVGLCRTERMFNAPERLPIVRDMIMSRNAEDRKKHLYRLFPFQLSDFKGIFAAMGGRPVVVRLLDLPLHEFLPPQEELLIEIQEMKESKAPEEEIAQREIVLNRVRQLSEHNPMLGHRGCRLAVTYPEIYAMQTKAILQAASEVEKEGGKASRVKIMIPLVALAGELGFLRGVVEGAAEDVFKEFGRSIDHHVGTMIETPRAALTAGEVAKHSDFFSFGTNDLTQTTFGFSRDDVEAKFIPKYMEMGILEKSPFDSVDEMGVGKLVRMAVEEGRKVKPGLEVGICGEHGGDPKSIAFFHRAGLDYVSCSAFRVPVARLAAAQATISAKNAATTA